MEYFIFITYMVKGIYLLFLDKITKHKIYYRVSVIFLLLSPPISTILNQQLAISKIHVIQHFKIF